MNVAHVDSREVPSRPRRAAFYVALALAAAALGLVVHALLSGPRLELLLVSLGLAAAAALVGLLAQAPGGMVVRHRD
jgi:hypothetical protein